MNQFSLIKTIGHQIKHSKQNCLYLSLSTGLSGLELTSREPSEELMLCSGKSGSGLLGGSEDTESLCILSLNGSGLVGASVEDSDSSLMFFKCRNKSVNFCHFILSSMNIIELGILPISF